MNSQWLSIRNWYIPESQEENKSLFIKYVIYVEPKKNIKNTKGSETQNDVKDRGGKNNLNAGQRKWFSEVDSGKISSKYTYKKAERLLVTREIANFIIPLTWNKLKSW